MNVNYTPYLSLFVAHTCTNYCHSEDEKTSIAKI